MAITLCETRRSILAEEGHMLVTGGPGCGKTTIALLKAKERIAMLLPEQQVLFLSFSRAAVQQIRDRTQHLLPRSDRQRLEVSTYHLFCMRLLEAHGRLLTGRLPQILYPGDEKLRKAADLGLWPREQHRLAVEEGIFAFDQFAAHAASLLERSLAVRQLIADRYPYLILDEFQDTDDDQWRLVNALAPYCTVMALADPDQRIFEYQGNIDPRRVEMLRGALNPRLFDFGAENHRSPRGEILRFANAVLRKTPLPSTRSVRIVKVSPKGDHWAIAPHAQASWLFSELLRGGVDDPSVAVLTRNNDCIARLSARFSQESEYQKRVIPPLAHQLVWDGDLAAAAGRTVASIMEWPGRPWREAAAHTLHCVGEFFRIKFADTGGKGARTSAEECVAAAQSVIGGQRISKKGPRDLAAAAQQQLMLTGVPVDDWRMARGVLESIGWDEIVTASRMLRLLRASDALAAGLHALWLQHGCYQNASTWLRRTLDRERVRETTRAPDGCLLMTMHKSKGKEFDGVVIAERPRVDLIRSGREEAESRRLLRVAITRARHVVVITRPVTATPLV